MEYLKKFVNTIVMINVQHVLYLVLYEDIKHF